MNTIGSKISTAASAINPFKGTVNTEYTSRDALKFLGVKITTDKSMGNFTLRKIYNSIVNAPGHAFKSVQSFTNYLYPETTSPLTEEDLETHNQTHGDAEEKEQKAIAEAAATKIQALGPGYVVRKEAEEQKAIAEAAATKIQALGRGYVVRKEAEEQKAIAEAAATKIQALGRGYNVRNGPDPSIWKNADGNS
jgi:cell division protein ZapA (FtsZ GTPase activity inhibitor)